MCRYCFSVLSWPLNLGEDGSVTRLRVTEDTIWSLTSRWSKTFPTSTLIWSTGNINFNNHCLTSACSCLHTRPRTGGEHHRTNKQKCFTVMGRIIIAVGNNKHAVGHHQDPWQVGASLLWVQASLQLFFARPSHTAHICIIPLVLMNLPHSHLLIYLGLWQKKQAPVIIQGGYNEASQQDNWRTASNLVLEPLLHCHLHGATNNHRSPHSLDFCTCQHLT